eukprot:1158397-Pelagomonas_calceolata.AAC.3
MLDPKHEPSPFFAGCRVVPACKDDHAVGHRCVARGRTAGLGSCHGAALGHGHGYDHDAAGYQGRQVCSGTEASRTTMTTVCSGTEATGMAVTVTLLVIRAGRNRGHRHGYNCDAAGHQGRQVYPGTGISMMPFAVFYPEVIVAWPKDARYVIWSRIDQKTCLKAITAAGGCAKCLKKQHVNLAEVVQHPCPHMLWGALLHAQAPVLGHAHALGALLHALIASTHTGRLARTHTGARTRTGNHARTGCLAPTRTGNHARTSKPRGAPSAQILLESLRSASVNQYMFLLEFGCPCMVVSFTSAALTYADFPLTGLEPVVVELQQRGDELCTDVQAIERSIEQLGSDAIVAVITTTSCFAPRASDDVIAVARICATSGIPHMINNAYGIQSSSICRDITAAWRKGAYCFIDFQGSRAEDYPAFLSSACALDGAASLP